MKDAILWVFAALGAWSFFKDVAPPAFQWVKERFLRHRKGKITAKAFRIIDRIEGLGKLSDTNRLIIWSFQSITVSILLFVMAFVFYAIAPFGGILAAFICCASLFILGMFVNTLDHVRDFEAYQAKQLQALKALVEVGGVAVPVREYLNSKPAFEKFIAELEPDATLEKVD